jgi:PAS domain S-box-containing protein
MNDDTSGATNASEANVPSFESLACLFRHMEYASARLAKLRDRASEELLEDTVVLEAFQELDSAHEELRVAEEQLHVQADAIAFAQEALELERQRHVDLFEGAPEPYFVTDLRGNILQANRCAAELLNIDSSFLPGKPLLTFVDIGDRERFADLLRVVTRQEQVLRGELRVRPRQSGDSVWVTISASRARFFREQPGMLRWLVRPRTQQRQLAASEREIALEAQLQKRIQELADTKYLLDYCLSREQETEKRARTEARNKDALLAAVAHEMRSPLRSISGLLDRVALDHPVPDSTARAFVSMANSLRLVRRLVEDLLDHERSNTGALTLACRAVELPVLLQEVIEASGPEAAQRQVRLVTELGCEVPKLEADPDRLQQVFFNRLDNALKFTPAGGEARVSLKRDGQYAEVVIQDTGQGIELERLPVLFVAFGPLSRGASAAQGGLGLGLYMARRLVELHGGTISADSDGVGHGSTFRVRLPLAIELAH